jgi:predicted TIM-barrel fold metal-dependent hydrolase
MTTIDAIADLRVIDTDTHVSEPPDLWTSRVASRLRDDVPRVEVHPKTGIDTWRIGDTWLNETGQWAMAGWKSYPPKYPRNLHDEGVDRGAWDPEERLRRMDEYGIHAAVLYPNIIGFETFQFMKLAPEASLACVTAYNDFLIDFASPDPSRFIPIAMVPFWDLDATVAEMERAAAIGHKGILFANRYERIDLPYFYDPYWDPVYGAAQSMGLSINFHVGIADKQQTSRELGSTWFSSRDPRIPAQGSSLTMLGNAETISNLIMYGLCERFPRLRFVSVESGFGYLPYLLESLDWHWKGFGLHHEYALLPSEYFRRQVYGTFWFETSTLPLLELYADNIMFETDYPHPTSMSPGPCSPADVPADHIKRHLLGRLPDDVVRKVLHDNAATLYGLDR